MGLYVCGITPYDAAHLGHAFTYVQFDVLVRYLRHLGADVVHVQNITDVDDDILRIARERDVSYLELADREVKAFDSAMRALGVTAPTMSPRATDYTPSIVVEVNALVAAGHGYERNGTVYFRVSSDPQYGRLSGLSRDEMVRLAAERGGRPEDPAKDDPLDFVLWQRSEEGEPWWESPWGRGRPGWHIECSTMALRLLGRPVDIHGGGSDLVFPHHECELAQAEGAPGGEEAPFVLHWMHTGMVSLEGTKMSKSLGNLAFIDDLLERHEPAAVRCLLLQHHYRDDWDFQEEMLVAEPYRDELAEFSPKGLRSRFFEALDDDLDTPTALRIWEYAERHREGDPQWRNLADEGRAILGMDL